MIISIDAGNKTFDKGQHPFMTKLLTKWAWGNIPQHNKGHI